MTTESAVTFRIPDVCVVMLVGASGSGKSTFAQKHFRPDEILSSDTFRKMISGDEDDQSATPDAFELLYEVAAKRLHRGKLTVIDATNVQPFAVNQVVRLGKECHAPIVAIVIDTPLEQCYAQNKLRARVVPDKVIKEHVRLLGRMKQELADRKSIRAVYTVPSADSPVTFERVQSRHYAHATDCGPFDIIGDVHGCYEQLLALITALGWTFDGERVRGGSFTTVLAPQPKRKLIFLGDMVDGGPLPISVLELVHALVKYDLAYCVMGNHEWRLLKKMRQRDNLTTVWDAAQQLLATPEQLTFGFATTLKQLIETPSTTVLTLLDWLSSLPSHLVLDNGKLVVCHAGIHAGMIGRDVGTVFDFCMYGARTEGRTPEGYVKRVDWAKDYKGKPFVAYGHVHDLEAKFRHNTICLDTDCVNGGKLTALRYPEMKLVSVDGLAGNAKLEVEA